MSDGSWGWTGRTEPKNYDQWPERIAAAFEAVESRGEYASGERVRIEMGTSNPTIVRGTIQYLLTTGRITRTVKRSRRTSTRQGPPHA